MKTRRNKYNLPKGWSLARVQRVVAHYEGQTEDDAVAEDEAAVRRGARTVMAVPAELVPVFRALIAAHGKGLRHPGARARKSR